MWPFSRSQPTEQARIEPVISASSPENPSTSLSDAGGWLGDLIGGSSFAGPEVNQVSAMRSSVVFRCVSLKAGLIASLPLVVYERTEKGRKEAVKHRAYPLLADQPTELMSAFTWKELITTNLMLAGNHYSIIEFDNASRVVGMFPMRPESVAVDRVNGRNRYTFRFKDGKETLDQEDVLHVPGLGFDGLTGLSPITWAGRQPIGLGLALEETVGRTYSNGMMASGAIEMPAGISPEALKRLKAEVAAMHSGIGNAGRVLYLDQGGKWNPLTISPQDMQTLESRRFQVVDICRLFGIPPHMVGETDLTTSWGAGIEQQTIGFLLFSIDPDLCRIEAELNRKLFKHPYYCQFDRDALRAMDSKTMAEIFASGVQNARYTPNEVRRQTNLPDLPGGDQLFIQGATVPIANAGKAGALNQSPRQTGSPQ